MFYLVADGALKWYGHIGKPVSVSHREARDSIHALTIIHQSHPLIVPQTRQKIVSHKNLSKMLQHLDLPILKT